MPWINQYYYRDMSEQMQQNNAEMIYSILSGLGWTINAVGGICGCIEGESRFNPWAWQGDRVQSTEIRLQNNPRGKAYGLIQWDSCLNYINSPVAGSFAGFGPNFSDQTGSQFDGDAQLHFINTGEGYYPRGDYKDISFSDYKASTLDSGYLAVAWMFNRQRNADKDKPETQQKVHDRGVKWYNYLLGASPPEPGTIAVTLQASPPGGGTLSGGGIVPIGSQVTIFANANINYEFSHWVIGGTIIQENPYTFIPAGSVVCRAIFNGGGGGGGGDKPLPTPIEGRRMKFDLLLKQRNKIRRV